MLNLGKLNCFLGKNTKLQKNEPKQTQGDSANSTQKDPIWLLDWNPGPSCCETKMVVHQQMVVHVLLCVAAPALHLLYVLLRACSRSQEQEHELLLPAVVQTESIQQ